MGLFEQFWAIGKETLDTLKKPLVKNKLQRKIKGAIDDCLGQKIDANNEITNLLSKDIENLDINLLLKQKQILKHADVTIQTLVDLYKDLFDETLVVEEVSSV